ncbi:MAG TPA: FMN-binding glutamate synthase family protein [Firmicutes bacterium]|nr:FMN-binding glutamate synthase family protein [Bacillota bacterium]
MSYSSGMGATEVTLTRRRIKDHSPFSGMCATCLDGCTGFCEVGRSAVRGREVLYPQPFGRVSAASQKDYPIDLSHFSIMGTVVGRGIEAESDRAIFPAVDVTTTLGCDGDLELRLPVFIPALGSTHIAVENWPHLAAGAALSGIGLVVGENVCAMDPQVEIRQGRVVRSPALEARVRVFREWYRGSGFLAVQANVEDTALGVHEYAISRLGVEAVEIKWGQGAKDIGGEVKLPGIERARDLKSKGYIVLPDPDDPAVQEAYERGAFTEFERHSRVGMVTPESFLRRVEELRRAGARYVFLKTGAYRPRDLALAVRLASEACVDLLTVDGAGGGTGMSPWRMMNEWGVPTVYLVTLLRRYMDELRRRGAYLPPVAVAGGFTLEDHVFKGLALAAPYAKAIGMARGPLAAAMVGKTVGAMLKEGKVPAEYRKFGDSPERVFVLAGELKRRLGSDFERLPAGAIGLYTYLERLGQGLRQLMAGARKFNLSLLSQDDLAALTEEASRVTGVPHIMKLDWEEAAKLLSGSSIAQDGEAPQVAS